MPQLDIVSYIPQIFWVLIRFFILYVCVIQAILPLIRRILWIRELKRTNTSSQINIAGDFNSMQQQQREKFIKTLPIFQQIQNLKKAQTQSKTTNLKNIWS